MEQVSPAPYEIVIERSRRWLRVDWRELWEYRDLLVLLVRRDFISRYQQTLLGPLWHLLQPVLTALIYSLIFGRIARIPTDGLPPTLFYLCSLLGWNYFAQNITTGSATFVANQHLFTKVWFPRLIVPFAVIASNVVALALQLITFFAFVTYYEFFTPHGETIAFTPLAFLTPLFVLHIAAASLGVGLWMAALSAKYRDLVHLNQFVVQLWMFATPVIYPLSKVPAGLKWLVLANPVSVPVEALRLCLLGRGTIDLVELIVSISLTIILLVTGIVAFQNAARSAVDTL